ncbi:MAG: tandem-95 repeat protein, partial [Planctomycetales bacterium]|nr:tandem-95 repeat protein [Planctomycetales bacterium]
MRSWSQAKRSRRNANRRSQWEVLEARTLLAGDLVANWRAQDLVATVADQAVVTDWVDSTSAISATNLGSPKLIHEAYSGLAAVRFDASDGVDAMRVLSTTSPMTNANDFSLVVVFATDSQALVGQTGPWYQNSGLVDGNSAGFGADWGLTINQAGNLSAGMGEALGKPTETIYSAAGNYNNGNVHIATLTRSGGTLNLYVDNVLTASTTAASTLARAQLDLKIGSTLSGNVGYTGDVAEVRIYNGQLDAGEVGAIYSSLYSTYNNTPPVANPDTYTFAEDADFFSSSVGAGQGVLVNDTDAENNSLTAVLVTPTSHGTVALSADGSFIYDSDVNYFGTDTFTYSARDAQLSAPTTVTINVTPKYDAATANPDQYKLLAGAPYTVAVADGLLANDLNPDLATLQAQVVQAPPSGSLTLNSDGSFTYDPQGFAGVTSFTYHINDGTGTSNTANVTLVVNTPPVANDDTYQIAEDDTLTRTLAQGVTGNDVDAENNSVTVTLESDVQHGNLTLSSDGSFTYRPDANYYGTDSFSYQLSDGIDVSGIATVTLNVISVNDAPVAVNDTYATTAGNSIDINAVRGVLQNDTDIEDDTLTAELVSGPTHGTLTLNTDGSLSYQPEAGYMGTDTFTYRANDGAANSSAATVTLSIVSLEDMQKVVINEVHVDPNIKTELVEFIELTNRSTVPIDVSGWSIRNAVDFIFPNGSIIQPGGFLVATENPTMFGTKFGSSAVGPWVGKLNNDADTIELWAATGDKIDEVDYQLGFPWPTYGDVPGPSIQLLNPAFDNSVGGNWRGA